MIIIDKESREELQESLSKRDLLEISELLGIDVDISERYSKIVDIIVEDCDNNGVPEWEDCTKLLRKFLIILKITDVNGEVIAKSEESPVKEEQVTELEYPECYGLADAKDPACIRCKVVEECLIKHKNSLPPCYGKSYSDTAEECALCIERISCKEIK